MSKRPKRKSPLNSPVPNFNIDESIPPFQLNQNIVLHSVFSQTDEKKYDVQVDFEESYVEKDIDFLKKIKKNAAVLYHKFVESKQISNNRSISLKDILPPHL